MRPLVLAGIALLLQAKALPSEADFKKAELTLAVNGEDPDANLTLGKYHAFVLGNYSAAMPFLARSSDKTLKSLAEHELDETYVDTAAKKVAMGDEWLTASKNFKPLSRLFVDRTFHWYSTGWPGLDGALKEKVRERFKKALLLPAPGPNRPGLPAKWESLLPNPKVTQDGTIAHSGVKSLRVDMVRDKPDTVFWVHTPMMVAPKGPVVFSAWVATDGTESAQDRIMINWYLADGSMPGKTGGGFIPLDTPAWQKLEVKAEVPPDVVRFRVAFDFCSPKGTVWTDDISVKAADGKEYVENGSFEK